MVYRPSRKKIVTRMRELLDTKVRDMGITGRLVFGFLRGSELVQCNPHDYPDARVPEKTGNLGYYICDGSDFVQTVVSSQKYDRNGRLGLER